MNRFIMVLVLMSVGLGGCAQEDSGSVNSLQGRILKVVVGETATDVDLGDLELVDAEGVQAVRLGDVIRAAGLDPLTDDYVADMVSVDGFHPGAKTPCKGLVPIDLAMLDKAYIAEFTGETLWDAALDYPGCMKVGGLAKIVLFATNEPGNLVRVGKGDTAQSVDLRFLPVTTEAADAVALRSVVGAVLGSPEEYRYDLEGTDGVRPGRDNGAQLLTWEELSTGQVALEGRDVTFVGDDVGQQWFVKGLVRIVPEPKDASGKSIEVTLPTGKETVDLGGLPTTEVGGADLVALSEVVLAAGLVDGTAMKFRLVASDGFDPVEVKDAELLTWEQISKGYLDPNTRDASWDASLGMAGYWSVKDVAQVVVAE